ncbi:head-to-tail connector [Mycobacterium phage Evanesce]|uniref:Tail terminator n=10 Tax=Caudoviricetes TaxID=2731619 RepID=A0A8T8JBI4_9CAUD|nr:tail terminator [Mycobacterium phage Giles]ALA06658.1 hypothetical protein SEA_OBUpride_14 [Mycobacterium phage OBUpride]ALF00235.1 head-to-tail connector [Mycobacterium phage Evanesce]QBQ71216.1 tail terminator [Mycobacterium phage Daegal]QDH48754.1 tail terminator [Mycobacterium phage DeepSoil15]QIQ62633.1 hypothetical protein SEA_EIN37_14 [Mycobacterium phage Ein37]QNN98768.1 tail terminator [Mycobacterium phage Hadrien]QOC58755.1 tail terminator [Mycobacterium phage Luke]QUE25415.1 t
MSDVRVVGDPVPPVKAYLAAFWGARVRIADEVPDDWHVETDVPLIVVDDDGGPIDWPVKSDPLVRCGIYANGKQTAKNLRRITMGALLAEPIPGIAHIQRTGIGYVDARDPDTGADIASFTVTATVRTEVITV